jgi:hypothetical protein
MPMTYAERLAEYPGISKKVEDYENTPMTDDLPAFIILGRKPGDNAYTGYVEHSFSMGESKDESLVFWSSQNAASNFGGKFVVDGRKKAENHLNILRQKDAKTEWEIYDVTDENIPVVLNWQIWHWANEPDYTLSGVRDKYRARNVKFSIKE